MSDDPAARSRLKIFFLFAAELLAIGYLRLPDSLSFDNFAFCDHGANLTVQYLLAHGLRPILDFGYHYGLLPLLVGRAWFAAFGLNPFAYQALMVACDIAMAWALATVAARLAFGVLGMALMFIAIGIAVQVTYPSLAQALEAVLLSFALAEQSAGRWRFALVFTAASIFAKPSMGYFYSLLLVVFATFEVPDWRTNLGALVRIAIPAAVTFSVLSIFLAAVFGSRVLIRSMVPIEGAVSYHALNFGFFTGSGSAIWRQPGQSWLTYLVTVSGFWIAGTLFLAVAGLFTAGRLATRESRDDISALRRDQLVIACAALHIGFVLLFFGNKYSWIYYSYFLVVGVAAAADSNPPQRKFAFVLCVLAALSWVSVAFWTHRWWQTETRDTDTAGLWATQDERKEWSNVLTLGHSDDLTILDTKGAAEILFRGFCPPVTLYLDPGLMHSLDIQRKTVQLSQARMVVVPTIKGACGGIPNATEFKTAINDFTPVWTGQYLEVFQRLNNTSNTHGVQSGDLNRRRRPR